MVALKAAKADGMTVAVIHSHPPGVDRFSGQDDRNEPDLAQLSYAQKLVTAISGGVFDLLDAVLERHSLDEFGKLV